MKAELIKLLISLALLFTSVTEAHASKSEKGQHEHYAVADAITIDSFRPSNLYSSTSPSTFHDAHVKYQPFTRGRRRRRDLLTLNDDDDNTARCPEVQQLKINSAENGLDIKIDMQLNDRLSRPYKYVVHDRVLSNNNNRIFSCHYHFIDANINAALSVFASSGTLHGVVHLPQKNLSLRILPTTKNSHSQQTFLRPQRNQQHLIQLLRHTKTNDDSSPGFQCAADVATQCPKSADKNRVSCVHAWQPPPADTLQRNPIALTVGPKTLELGVFLDASSYGNFVGANNVFSSEDEMEQFLLAFINQVALLYRHPSLGDAMEIQIVHMQVYSSSSQQQFTAKGGDLSTIFANFSPYQKSRNPLNRTDPGHWDLALLLTGEDLNNKGQQRSALGAALIGSMCDPDKSIAMVELGTADDPAIHQDSGFLAAYSAAHEIAHTIGITHDALPDSACQSAAFIMAPTKTFSGQTSWSECSRRQFAQNIASHSCLTDKQPGRQKRSVNDGSDLPGQIYTANDQCKIHLKSTAWLRDERQKLSDVCNSLKCTSENSSYPVAVGPALDGTYCGGENWCFQGICQSWSPFSPPIVAGGWSDWQSLATLSGGGTLCQSSCTLGALGVRLLQRTCTNPKRRNTIAGCDGPSIRREICTDYPACAQIISNSNFASKKCQQWAKSSEYVSAPGLQMPYNVLKPNDSCHIYCLDPTTNKPWNPQSEVEFLLGEDAAFPDGTVCGVEMNSGDKLYCLNKLCTLP